MRLAVTVLLGGLLTLQSCGGETEPAAGPPAVRTQTPAAETLLAFAQGTVPGADVPWGDEVVYSVEGTPMRTLDPGTASTYDAWDVCPEGTATLEGRECPVNVLRSLTIPGEEGSSIVMEDESPGRVMGCVRYRAPEVRGATTAWLRPAKDYRSCFTDLAVAVSTSADGEVVAVDLALSGP